MQSWAQNSYFVGLQSVTNKDTKKKIAVQAKVGVRHSAEEVLEIIKQAVKEEESQFPIEFEIESISLIASFEPSMFG